MGEVSQITNAVAVQEPAMGEWPPTELNLYLLHAFWHEYYRPVWGTQSRITVYLLW